MDDCDPQSEGIDVRLLEHVSPIEWKNVLLYGEYVIDRDRIRALSVYGDSNLLSTLTTLP